MALLRIQLVLVVFVVVMGMLCCCCLASSRHNVPGMFVFGDSQLDSGTNNYLKSVFKANFPPYGRSYFHSPTGRFTNGRTVSDFIAHYLDLPFPSPYLASTKTSLYVNFASGGSGALDSTFKELGVLSLSQQVEHFKDAKQRVQDLKGKATADRLIAKSLFLVSSGSNDIFLFFKKTRGHIRPAKFIKDTMSSFHSAITQLHELGARKIVVFGVGPLGCVPAVVGRTKPISGSPCVEVMNTGAIEFNDALRNLTVHQLPASLKGSTIVFADGYGIIKALITDGAQLGFEYPTTACCGSGRHNGLTQCGTNRTTGYLSPRSLLSEEAFTKQLCRKPSRSVFWDFAHPTERVYNILAESFWLGKAAPNISSVFSGKVVFPMSISDLVITGRLA